LTRVETAPGQARLWPEVDLTGERLGGHTLHRRLGSGGMGTVYEAESDAGVKVALKVLSPLLAAEPALRERFRREARAMTKVKHPRVVQLFDEGEDRGFCWYSMELVTGVDLRQRLSQEVMTPTQVEALADQVLEALEAVHSAGIVHRDLKPANILMSAEGPRLCDFGIAQLSGVTTLTESAALLGSLRYMAPEQRWGKADERSDLYSLGVVLHEALTGGVPGETPLPASVPRSLSRFIERLTQQNAGQRPSSARAAVQVLLGHRKRSRQRVLMMGAAAAMLLTGVVAAFASGDSSDAELSEVKAPAPLAPIERVDVIPIENAPEGAPLEADAGVLAVDSPPLPTELTAKATVPVTKVAKPPVKWPNKVALKPRFPVKQTVPPPSKKKTGKLEDLTP
jgi:serine/threonine-protein kinase